MLDRLSLLSANHVQVLRDGKAMQITLEEIVLDDLLVLANGDQIPCDAIVVQGKLECNESLVTGEAEVIRKEEGSFLYSGSFVISGKCMAQVCAVGKETYVHTILEHAKQVRRHPSQLRDAINFIIKTASIVIVPMGLPADRQSSCSSRMRRCMMRSPVTVAGVLGMIPEGLVLLTSVALAVGTDQPGPQPDAGAGAVLHRDAWRGWIRSCFDKTGTLTAGSDEGGERGPCRSAMET